ncbi:DUF4157 domain-containing protein [Nocardia sp. XZ_19_231]|uniref:eCIS core domain-containing protein n=1 Tax=Nocardia sp. XZ_19_231 TaxID=2769252 RepID=UPI0018905C9E|nr:DUF4157 domain-containing protein [Nocardia sp. XZ_19_231]
MEHSAEQSRREPVAVPTVWGRARNPVVIAPTWQTRIVHPVEAMAVGASGHFAHGFCRISTHRDVDGPTDTPLGGSSAVAPAVCRTRVPWEISSPTDADEVAADRKAATVRSRLRPGTAATPQALGPVFGHDFSNVRIHTDGVAEELSRSVNAEAVTIGRQIFFGRGAYEPHIDRGRELIVHELAHVTQHDANRAPRVRRQFAGCADLSEGPNMSLLSGIVVHQLIEKDFALRVPGALSIGIPGGSFAPYRTGGTTGGPPNVVPPQTIGGAAGMGKPDLARRNEAGVLSVAEIKPALPDHLLEGETQLAGYIAHGNATDHEQVMWRAGAGVTVVVPMLPSVYQPPQLVVPIPGAAVVIKTAWCMPGLLAYAVQALPHPSPKSVGADERERERERLSGEVQARNLAPVAVGAVAAVGLAVAGRALWRHFWKAVAVRFAIRGAVALGLSAADGPLPFGELVSLGLAVVTIVQIGVEWNELWRQADAIAASEGA